MVVEVEVEEEVVGAAARLRAAHVELDELPAEQSAESLLFGLDGLQKADLTWLYWMLEGGLRLGYLGARELLALKVYGGNFRILLWLL